MDEGGSGLVGGEGGLGLLGDLGTAGACSGTDASADEDAAFSSIRHGCSRGDQNYVCVRVCVLARNAQHFEELVPVESADEVARGTWTPTWSEPGVYCRKERSPPRWGTCSHWTVSKHGDTMQKERSHKRVRE